ncbi:MAG TPA: NAD(P)-dependent oxidoreductase [Noviherbaspirillum sp.]|uniref:NAD(P)-dependent oxidoreductase n=1 Tax=Noviherbaspirillum sp. TaxID=1926288 RepID=UPI002B4A11A6|nr:NAD(P)-dependent oxidoreductase [Noviherbaspirillum sp.]HJV84863.1 NAD(P)-dependent oxidoreductase [Noviherbaspirillum sp.]
MSVSKSLPTIAFLGIGLMGKPMAGRLLQAGYKLTVWNRTPTKAQALTPLGARVADTPAEAVAGADIIITMLEAGPVVRQVIEAALPGLRQGALVIDMSSTRQSEAQDLTRMLANRGVGFVDAPVSGGVVGAEAGTLAIMAGGSVADFARAEPILAVMGRPVHVGPAGCGQVAKLCNQMIVGGTLSIIAEALLLAQAGGADPVAVRMAIRGGFAESRILEVHGQRMLDRNFLPGGQVKSQTKDLENVLIAANAAGVQLPVTELVTQIYRSIVDIVPNADQSAALLALERLNSGKRLGDAPDKLP